MATGPTPVLSEALQKRMKLSLATQGGDLGAELIQIVERAIEINETSATTSIFDQEILQLNNDGSTANLTGAGLAFEGDAAAVVGYMRIGSADTSLLEFKSGTGSELTLDITADATFAMDSNFSVTGVSAIDQDVQVAASPTWVKTTVTGLDMVLNGDGFATTIRSSSTAARVLTLPDTTDTLATLSDIAGNNELSEILANGNTTGAFDISIDAGQKLITDTIQEQSSNGVTILVAGEQVFFAKDNFSAPTSTANTANPVSFLSARNATANAGIANALILGGTGLTADENETAFAQKLKFASSINQKIIADVDSNAFISFNSVADAVYIAPSGAIEGFEKSSLFLDETFADLSYDVTFFDAQQFTATIAVTNVVATSSQDMFKAENDSATFKMAFFGATTVAQPAAITQTFATTSATHAARTAATLTDNGGGAAANGTIDAIADIALSTGDTYTDAAVNTAVNALVTDTKDAVKELSDQINKLIADQVNTAQVLNLAIDDLQALGLRA